MTDRINLGLVGAGAVARAVHLPILTRRSDLFEVVAICDPSEHSVAIAADRFGISHTFSHLEAMLDGGGLDAVMATHSGSHSSTVLAAQDSGVQVFSEKPLAYTRAEVDAIDKAATHPVMVGYMKPYDPAVVAAVDYLADLPEVRSIEVAVLHPTAEAQLATSELEPPPPQRPDAPPPPDESDLLEEALGPAASKLGEIYTGILLGSISHDLSVMRALGAEIDVIDRARYWESDGGHRSVALTGRATDDSDVSIRWHYLPGYPSYREEVRFHTDLGSVDLVFPAPYLLRAPTQLRVATASTHGTHLTLESSYEEAFERELVSFHAMVTDGSPPKDGIASGRADVITAQRMARALAESIGLTIGGEAGELPR